MRKQETEYWTEFNETALEILLLMGHRYFVYIGLGDGQCNLYPCKTSVEAINILDGYEEPTMDKYIIQDGEQLRDLAYGVDVLDIKVLYNVLPF